MAQQCALHIYCFASRYGLTLFFCVHIFSLCAKVAAKITLLTLEFNCDSISTSTQFTNYKVARARATLANRKNTYFPSKLDTVTISITIN